MVDFVGMKGQMVNRRDRMGFTLVELLIVTVVIVSLMAVVFRLTGIAGNASNRETTVYRMQCLENCLSGYFATFGSYPPVPLQGTKRNIYLKTQEKNPELQSDDDNDVDDSKLSANSVIAACRAQPVAAMYPPPKKMSGYVDGKWEENKDANLFYESYIRAVQAAYEAETYSEDDMKKIDVWKGSTLQGIDGQWGFLNKWTGELDFRRLQLFRYGLMSFLLPRYRFMLDCAKGSQSGNTEAFNSMIDRFSQWTDVGNALPPRMDTGIPYENWKSFCNTMGGEDDWQIDLIPSQAACARWMPNLKDIVTGPRKEFFGVDIATYYHANGIPETRDAAKFKIYFPGGKGSSSSRGYPLQSLTVCDGWGVDFYYYSPAPYQTYVLWSSGADRKTFPPWVDLEQFRKDYPSHYGTAVQWMADDIKFMSTGK